MIIEIDPQGTPQWEMVKKPLYTTILYKTYLLLLTLVLVLRQLFPARPRDQRCCGALLGSGPEAAARGAA